MEVHTTILLLTNTDLGKILEKLYIFFIKSENFIALLNLN